jgi:transglutaminase-like putative cysteine protease
MTFHRALPLIFSAAITSSPLVSADHPDLPHPPRIATTIASDTIYALAVDSTAYRQYPFVYLLDEGVARFEADGRGTRTYHQVIQILKPAGVARWAEQQIAYQPDREKVTVNWMRVVRPSGEVISDKPVQSQVSDVPAAVMNPVYTQTKVLRYSLSNVSPGTLVDLSWTIETIKPPLAGDLRTSWNVSVQTPGMRSRFVLDVPATYVPRIVENHLDFKRTETTQGGRHIFTWATENVKPPKGEAFAPDSSLPAMGITVGAPMTWAEIARWYNGLAKDRYVLTPALTTEIDSIVRPARTADDTLKALHKWIAKDLRYVSIALGIGGYQPRSPAATVGTGYGDCKDKATLFIAAARHVGITAYPVLLNIYGGNDRKLPAVEQFNHVIAAIPNRGKAGYSYRDLTTYAFPDGEIAPSYQGGFGLVVLPDGSSQEITFPKDSAGTSDQRFVGELTPDGKVSGTLTFTAEGPEATRLRAAFAEPLDSAGWANLKRGAPKPFPGATLDTVILFDATNRAVPPSIQFVLKDGEGTKPAGNLSILTIPPGFRGGGQSYATVAEELSKAEPRRLPIDAAKILGTGSSRRELTLTLPEGWTAQLPDSVMTASDFGTYRVQYRQTGRQLKILRIATGSTKVLPPSSSAALVDWFKLLAKDDAQFIAIMRKS